MLLKTVNHFPKIKEEFSVKEKIFSVGYVVPNTKNSKYIFCKLFYGETNGADFVCFDIKCFILTVTTINGQKTLANYSVIFGDFWWKRKINCNKECVRKGGILFMRIKSSFIG
jgi:hypothetical protein